MGLPYDFYENPPRKDSNKKRLHARVVPAGTMGMDEITRFIESSSSLTSGDVKATLTSLVDLMVRELSYGWRIHLEGLGYFELTLSCPSVRSPKEIRAESIHIKSIIFRPEAELKKKFKTVPVERVRRKNHSLKYSGIEIDGILTTHFMDHPYITARQLQRICGYTRTTAHRRIKQLIADGKLQKSEHHRTLYEPVKGNYRR